MKLYAFKNYKNKKCKLCGEVHEYITKKHKIIMSYNKDAMIWLNRNNLFGELTEAIYNINDFENNIINNMYDHPLEICLSEYLCMNFETKFFKKEIKEVLDKIPLTKDFTTNDFFKFSNLIYQNRIKEMIRHISANIQHV